MKGMTKYIKTPKTPFFLFLVGSIGALGLGLVAGMVNAQDTAQHLIFEFADGPRGFCVDKGRMDVGHMDYEENPPVEFLTPEDAVNAYITALHAAASREDILEDLKPLLEPSRQFDVSERKDISENLIYFDLPSKQKDLLEARIVVERVGDGFYITETFICEAQLVTNSAEVEQVWSEEMEKNANP